MAKRKKERAPKKSSAARSSRVTYYYRTKFVAYGDLLLGRDHRLPVKVALPADDWCIGVFQVTPLSAFGERVVRQDLSRLDVIELYIAGSYIYALVAAKGDKTIWIYADEVLRGLAHRVAVKEDRLYGDRRKGDAKLKKAQQRRALKNG
jgi:hypothetical protein